MDKFIRTTAIDKLLKLSKTTRVIPGGSSASKTFGILAVLIDKCAKVNGLEVSVVSESIPHLRRGAMKDFEKIMKSTNRWNHNNFSRTHLKYTFHNGSYIEFFGSDQPDKLRGARRDILYINEANNVSFEAYQQLSMRTKREIYIDFNPTHEFWAHTELRDDQDTEWLKLTYKDNEALDDSIVKKLEKGRIKAKTSSYWANWWKVYGLGEIGSLQGVVFENWQQIDKIPEGAKYLCTGLDFGFTNDPTAAVDVYRYEGKVLIDEVIYQTGLHNNEIAKFLNNRVVYADAAEPKSISEISRHGVRISAAKKGKDSITYGIDLLQQQEMLVTSNSTNVIKELRSYTWDKDKEGKQLNKPIDAFNHSIDALRYAAVMRLQANRGKYHIR